MKKLVSLLVVLALTISMSTVSYSAKAATKATVKAPVITQVAKVGVLKNFTPTTITVGEAGKTVVYTLAKNAQVLSLGVAANIMEVAKKGLKVQYKVQYSNGKATNIVTYLDIPSTGNEYLGLVSLGVTDTHTTVADSNAFAPSTATYNSVTGLVDGIYYSKTENPVENDNVYVIKNTKTLALGFINIVKGTLKVNLNGKDLKVIEASANFDPAVVGDEAKLVGTPGTTTTGVPGTDYTVELEAPFTTNESISQEEADAILKITFDKKAYTLTELDLFSSPINEDVYAELNGKEVPFAKALYRGNCAIVRSNAMLEIVYVGAYYNDLSCKIVSISGKNITIDVLKNGVVAFRDTVVLSDFLQVFNKAGEELTKSNLAVGDLIKLTVDPYENYGVTLITTVNK